MYDVIIIGGGASGLMCAIEAGKRKRRVIVLDSSKHVAQKILVSGGGWCNFSNVKITEENYISENINFCKSALAKYKTEDIISFLERHNIPYQEKNDGQLFCKQSAKVLLVALLKECERYKVKIFHSANIKSVDKNENFQVVTDMGRFESVSLVVATGGPSFKKLGATDFGFKIAKKFGLRVTNIRQGLVPLLFNHDDLKKYSSLSGVSFNGRVSCNGKSFTGDILFTHKGLSGPAILQISSYWSQNDPIIIDIPAILPKKLAKIWPKRPCNWKIIPGRLESYDLAHVTVGGVDTKEISSKTFESSKVKGLYFIGEVLDVAGELGGYNLHWAWASGHAAGQFV